MKFALAFILCSYVADSCMPPIIYPVEFDSEYECLRTGYAESLFKIEQMGEYEVNTHRLYIKFGCYEAEQQEQET